MDDVIDPRVQYGLRDRERQAEIYLRVHAAMLTELGHPLVPGCAILDFGSGNGATVYRYRRAGYAAFGVDIADAPDTYRRKMEEEGLATSGDDPLRRLDLANYRLPFDDDSFSFVFSHQVFEHVQDYDQALREIHRVLAPGGASLHVFPPRWSLREAHTFVPLAGVLRARPYLRLWAALGLRNQFQQGLSAVETTERNYTYLQGQTNYLSRRQIAEHVRAHFGEVVFAERLLLRYRLRQGALLSRIPFAASLTGAFFSRAVFFRKPVLAEAPAWPA